MARRPAGTGSLFVRTDAGGRETYYATWYQGGRKVKRRIGAKRAPGTRTGLTKTQAEAELRRLIGEVRTSVPRQDRITVELAGERYIEHLESVKRRKPTTSPTTARSCAGTWRRSRRAARSTPLTAR